MHETRFEPSGPWVDELTELAQRRAQVRQMGGPEAVAKYKARGRNTARERIDLLLDAGSFRELGRITGKGRYDAQGRFESLAPVNAIMGTGRVDGRKLVVSADDYTIRAGSSEGSLSDKWVYAERMALTLRMPIVRLVDTAGGSVKLLAQMQGTKIPGYSNWPGAELLRTVPVVGVALGACAGLGAVKVLLSHFSVMVRDQAQVFAAGPPVVKQAYGIDIDKNDLGGYKVHRKSALVHNEAVDEADALRQVAQFLSYLPRSVYRLAERTTDRDKKISRQAQVAQLAAIREAGLGEPHDLSKITQPTFVANGDNDVMVASSQSRTLAERIPDSKLVIYPDSGHGGIFQYREQFVPELLQFLEAA